MQVSEDTCAHDRLILACTRSLAQGRRGGAKKMFSNLVFGRRKRFNAKIRASKERAMEKAAAKQAAPNVPAGVSLGCVRKGGG